MCRHSSLLNKVAFLVFVAGCVAAGLGFAAPFWVKIPDHSPISLLDKTSWYGLWATCCRSADSDLTCIGIWGHYDLNSNIPPCTWTWNTVFNPMGSDIPGWHTASQIIYSCAIGFLVLGFVIECIYHCCRCCKNPSCFPTVVASFALAGALLIGLSLALYGGFSYQEGVFHPYGVNGNGGQLDWSFYVAIAASGTCLIAAILYYIDGCAQARSYGNYKASETSAQ